MTSTEQRHMPEDVRLARKLLGKALGVDLGLKDFGHLLGYEGNNVFQSAQRLERGREDGGRSVSGVMALRLADLMQAAALTQQQLIVIPEWVFEASADEGDDDGSSLFLTRLWFPRLRFVATTQAGPLLSDLGYEHVGHLRTIDPDFPEADVYCLAQDILPKPEWYTPFYEEAVNILALEANRQVMDI